MDTTHTQAPRWLVERARVGYAGRRNLSITREDRLVIAGRINAGGSETDVARDYGIAEVSVRDICLGVALDERRTAEGREVLRWLEASPKMLEIQLRFATATNEALNATDDASRREHIKAARLAWGDALVHAAVLAAEAGYHG